MTAPHTPNRIVVRVCSVLFVITLPLALALAELGRFMNQREASRRVLVRAALARDAIPLGLAWLSQLSVDGNPVIGEVRLFGATIPLFGLSEHLTLDDWRAITAELLPPQMVVRWIDDSLAAMDRWLAGEDQVPEVSYDLRELKHRALSTHGFRAIEIGLQAAPPCPSSEVAHLQPLTGTPALERAILGLRCALPAPYDEQQLYAHAAHVPDAVASLLDEFTLEDALLLDTNPSTELALELSKSVIAQARKWLPLAPAVPLMLLLTIALLAVRSWRGLSQEWGSWLAAGGLVTILLAALVGELVPWLLGLLSNGADRRELLRATGTLANSLAAGVTWPLFVRGAAALALSEALRLVSRRSVSAPAHPDPGSTTLAEAA